MQPNDRELQRIIQTVENGFADFRKENRSDMLRLSGEIQAAVRMLAEQGVKISTAEAHLLQNTAELDRLDRRITDVLVNTAFATGGIAVIVWVIQLMWPSMQKGLAP